MLKKLKELILICYVSKKIIYLFASKEDYAVKCGYIWVLEWLMTYKKKLICDIVLLKLKHKKKYGKCRINK